MPCQQGSPPRQLWLASHVPGLSSLRCDSPLPVAVWMGCRCTVCPGVGLVPGGRCIHHCPVPLYCNPRHPRCHSSCLRPHHPPRPGLAGPPGNFLEKPFCKNAPCHTARLRCALLKHKRSAHTRGWQSRGIAALAGQGCLGVGDSRAAGSRRVRRGGGAKGRQQFCTLCGGFALLLPISHPPFSSQLWVSCQGSWLDSRAGIRPEL